MKFDILNKYIKEATQNYDPDAIFEVTSFEQLIELSSVGGGGVHGYAAPIGDINNIKKFNKKQKKDQALKGKKLSEGDMNMFKRKDIILETRLRGYIRTKIKNLMHDEKKAQMQEEMHLRRIIRRLIKEGDISDIHPHRSTGINILEDLLKKMVPTIRTDFKRLTTDKAQRDSFRAHFVKAIKDSLTPMMVNDKYRPEDDAGEVAPAQDAGSLLSEPPSDESGDEEGDLADLAEVFDILDEIEVDIGDEKKKIPVEDDDTPSDEEAFGTGLESLDETGRNMAFTCFKKVSQYILDAYDSLANPKDKEIFIDYLITNVKLYFDKFEDELQKTVDEPTTTQYDDTKV